MILSVENIHAGYGRIPVLNGVSFAVNEHEVVGILGHNGMGKTTLLKALIGQVPVNTGAIRFAGKDITREPSYRRARSGIGYVPQGRAIFPSLTVRDNLRMGFVENGADAEESVVNDILARFPRLDPLIDRMGSALSGGEPTEGIQPSIVDEILEILIGLHRHQGLAIIVVEQSLDFIRSISERTLLIEKGVITSEVLPAALGQSNVLGGGFLAAE
jgi:ABC-type branched-subunit amino acid transport system ATPase component